MVRRLTRDGDGVAVVIGKAGTGKTYALDAAREAWEASGIRVTGVALAARAALELRDAAGIESTTLARLLGQLDDPSRAGTSPLQPGQVLVVDEAGMIGTRQLARLLHHTDEQGVKVVLVGDPRQLPEIDAGGLFTALTRQLPAIELSENRRQTHRWEQATLDQLRHGDPEAAVRELRRTRPARHGRHRRGHPGPAGGRLVDHLRPDRARRRRHGRAATCRRGRPQRTAPGPTCMRPDGSPDPTLTLDDGTVFQAGDRVVCLRNDRPGRTGQRPAGAPSAPCTLTPRSRSSTTTAPTTTSRPGTSTPATSPTGTRSPATRPKG